MTSPGLEILFSNSMTFPGFPWPHEPWKSAKMYFQVRGILVGLKSSLSRSQDPLSYVPFLTEDLTPETSVLQLRYQLTQTPNISSKFKFDLSMLSYFYFEFWQSMKKLRCHQYGKLPGIQDYNSFHGDNHRYLSYDLWANSSLNIDHQLEIHHILSYVNQTVVRELWQWQKIGIGISPTIVHLAYHQIITATHHHQGAHH